MTALASNRSAAPGPDFALRPQDFERIRRLIREHAGIHLHDGKQAMVYSRVARRLRETRQPDFATYLQWLEGATGPAPRAEWQQFVNCLTTNLTSFFREEHHFMALADDLRPRASKPLRLWCSAASTGEEAYSMAMTAVEALGSAAPVQVLASDIDTQVLATAREGIYEAQSRGLSPQRLRRHFLRGTGAHAGRIRVRPELARLLEFRHFNLTSADWSSWRDPLDIVFCRNVMIYFDHATQRRLLERLHGVLRPGGLLYVGHSENFSDARELFRLRGKTIYERA